MDDLKANKVVVPLSIFSTFAIAANILVCFLVLSQQTMRAYCNRFVVSLAISDIITGTTMFIQYNVELKNYSRDIVNLMYSFVFFCGAFNLCAVTYERFLAVMKPFKYKNIIAKVFKTSIPSIWLLSLLFSILPFIWKTKTSKESPLIHKIYILASLGVAVFCYGFILFANFCIFRVVRQSVRREKELFLAVRILGKNESDDGLRAAARKLCSEAKIARVFVLVALVFFLSWFPTLFYSTAAAMKESVPVGILHMSPFAIVLGSAVNPVIYSFMKPDFRKALQKTFCKKTVA